MRFSLLAAASAASTLLGLTSAQSGTPTPTASAATPTGTGDVTAHVVMVGDSNGTLTFIPDSITAPVGDLIQFQFWPRNHSVAQSAFDDPCQPMPETNGTAGFWSGFMPVTPESVTMPVFTVEVTSTAPMWFYCATGRHCQAGMAGVINPPNNPARTLTAYKEAAALAAGVGVPGSSGGTGGSTPTTGGGSGGGASPTNGSAEATGTGTSGASGLVLANSYYYSALVGALVVALAYY